MSPVRVPHEKEIFKELEELGFEKTGEKTRTGEFWRHKPSGRHLQVPFSILGFFPDWLCWQFKSQASEIASTGIRTKAKAGAKAKAKPKRR